MVVVDSSGWIEFYKGGPDGARFQPAMQPGKMIVPSIVVCEIQRFVLGRGSTDSFQKGLQALFRHSIADLTAELATFAAQLGVKHKLALADSIIYATARAHSATLWTMDSHFEGLPGVRYIKPGKK